MGLKLNLDPSVPKVVVIAILLFIEGLAVPAYTITQQGRIPTETEWVNFILGAIIQLVTYLLTFLGYTPTEEEE